MVPERIDRIVAAATGVFAERGYREAQMADIARAAGMSAGGLYNYVEGKEALLHLVLQHAFAREPLAPPATLPVPGPALADTAEWLDRHLDFGSDFVVLVGALDGGTDGLTRAGCAREVRAVVGELYDVLARLARGIDVLERVAVALPPEFGSLFAAKQARLRALLTDYIDSRAAAGLLAAPPDPRLAAHHLIESTNWLARRAAGHGYPEAVARATAVELGARAAGARAQNRRGTR